MQLSKKSGAEISDLFDAQINFGNPENDCLIRRQLLRNNLSNGFGIYTKKSVLPLGNNAKL